MSKKNARLKFPHIVREISAKAAKPLGTGLRWSVLLLMVGLNVYFWGPWGSPPQDVLGDQAQIDAAATQANLAFWQDIANSHPVYKDAHRMVAVIAYEAKVDDIAREAAQKVLTLDPNDGTAQTILTALSSSQAP